MTPHTQRKIGVRHDSRSGNGSTAYHGLQSAGVKAKTVQGNVAFDSSLRMCCQGPHGL
jgi:hypothetical protein